MRHINSSGGSPWNNRRLYRNSSTYTCRGGPLPLIFIRALNLLNSRGATSSAFGRRHREARQRLITFTCFTYRERRGGARFCYLMRETPSYCSVPAVKSAGHKQSSFSSRSRSRPFPPRRNDPWPTLSTSVPPRNERVSYNSNRVSTKAHYDITRASTSA